jgi:elongation factor Ts
MEISAALVKELREKTGAGVMDCKTALKETKGDVGKAVEHLRKTGVLKAAKKADRPTGEGIIASYVHAGSKLAVLVEINCETDFVARTDVFRTFAKDVAMHIAAQNPLVVSREELPGALLEKEREIYREQAKQTIATLGENIRIARFVRMKLGETAESGEKPQGNACRV